MLLNSLAQVLVNSLAQSLHSFSLYLKTVKNVVQEMPQKSCDLDPIPTSVLYDCLDEIIPIVTSIINKSLSSGIVPDCFKHALVKPLLKKASLDLNC